MDNTASTSLLSSLQTHPEANIQWAHPANNKVKLNYVMPPPQQCPLAVWGAPMPVCPPQCGVGAQVCSFKLGTDGKHVAFHVAATRLKQTVKLVLDATKHLSI